MNDIIVIGPKDKTPFLSNSKIINTTSHSKNSWSLGLSPFHLGPVKLYKNYVSLNMENGWQFSKVYKQFLKNNEITEEYWKWAISGWSTSKAIRYPIYKNAKPEFLYWNGERLDYIQARCRVYFQLYRDVVKYTESFAILQEYHKKYNLILWDFDGYNTDDKLSDIIRNPRKKMGHAFVLKAMLLYGIDVTVEKIFVEEDTLKDDFDEN